MTDCVLIRLDAPMQSWGALPRGAYRTTHTRPTKTGVIGLVANALGRDYADSIADLAALRFAVRADRPGRVEVDFHTSGGGRFPLLPGDVYADAALRRKARTRDPRQPGFWSYAAPAWISRGTDGELVARERSVNLTRDRYLADSAFLVALGGDPAVLAAVAQALRAPARPVFLGRKAFPPSAPLYAGYRRAVDGDDPFAALRTAARLPRSADGPLHAWAEVAPGSPAATVVHDQPISYAGTGERGARAETHTLLAPPPGAAGTDYDFFGTP